MRFNSQFRGQYASFAYPIMPEYANEAPDVNVVVALLRETCVSGLRNDE